MKTQRKNFKIFGENSSNIMLSVIGGLRANAVEYTDDPEEMQKLANYVDGLEAIVMGDNSPAMEDINSLFFVLSYMIFNIFQSGVPEWNDETTYYENSLVSFEGKIFKCVADDTTGIPLTIGTAWVPYDSMVPKEIIDQASYDVLNTDSYLRVIPEDAPPYRTDINLPPLADVAIGFKLTVKNCAEPLSTMIVSVIGETESIDGKDQIDLDIRDSITIIKGSETSWDII